MWLHQCVARPRYKRRLAAAEGRAGQAQRWCAALQERADVQAAALAARAGEAAELARRLARAEAAPAALPPSGASDGRI